VLSLVDCRGRLVLRLFCSCSSFVAAAVWFTVKNGLLATADH